ncbi:extracellular catalytic domain type 1 short-chain-length polyhydroxyalkanoate depolymerase [Sphingomonas sp. M1-B02]|uniref:extracellular catalytic domain type 1 short-chain-length polyhydroxyalkanoate depolymerase n=1 Tax=Sphingomonas sp. M1-B02 TaxID=3114300 RepID=UPI002240257E|nr:PHB depolymerase family esterase [Sphingomonas sp. S6-11]UZK64697.1 PHB depolymerase family esterase [Sphingomonas sp. S6-11]
MRNLNDTITRLAALRAMPGLGKPEPAAPLADLIDFGSNPGALRARRFVPEDLAANAPLVVVLHGCTQTAAGYDHGSGWSTLAARHGFALLFPEQQRTNNSNLCFNWFAPEDARRDRGEAESIRQMIEAMIAELSIDHSRIFVTGLSAGGAMTSVMLAAYPELFASGAIIAGLPFATANSVPQAFDRMRGHGSPSEADLSALVRDASSHEGPWPTLSVWHGTADATVSKSNAAAIIGQWRPLHGAAAEPSLSETVDGQTRRVWRDAKGRDVIEEYSIAGLGHGTPLETQGEDGVGTAGPYMLEANISSTRHIANFWGLLDAEVAPKEKVARAKPAAAKAAKPASSKAAKPAPAKPAKPKPAPAPTAASGVTKIIEDALRAAGLMR